MARGLRSLLTLALVAALVWCSFNVDLGDRTFSQHMDRIGQTPEAKELLDGSRNAVQPIVHEATDRLMGEYIEAPTALSETAPVPESAGPPKAPPAR